MSPPDPPYRRIANFWSWLPAFRAIAETEHLPTASARLHVSPSALSRTLRLLEEEVGAPLFERAGKQLRLNPAGALLLERTREAMRHVDEGLLAVHGQALVGPVRISSVGLLTSAYLLPALTEVCRTHPGLVPELSSQPVERALEGLLSGQVDLAFHEEPTLTGELVSERLGCARSAVFCGRGHPLFARNDIGLDEVLAHSFACPPQVGGKPSGDGWPPEVRRRVGLVLSHLALSLEVALSGAWLVVLPEPIARPHEGAALSRLPCPELRVSELFAARRRPLGERDRASVVLEAVRARIARA